MNLSPDQSVHPLTVDHNTPGLTIRQEFAARAMQGLIGSEEGIPKRSYRELAAVSVIMADALITELNKPKL